MNNVISIMMIDDDKDNYHSLKNVAAGKGIILKYSESLEEMIEELKTNWQIDGVILDGKGFLKKGQQKGSEKENFVHQALTELRILEKEQDRLIPKCVYTAWYDLLKDGLESRVKVFDKKKLALNEALMNEFFEYLINEVNNSHLKKIRIKYRAVLDGFSERYLPTEKEVYMMQVLILMDGNSLIQKNHFNIIRDILEAIFKRANAIDIKFMPNDLIKSDGRPNLEWCYRYLSGLKTDVKDSSDNVINSYPQKAPIASPHIGRCIDFVKNISSILSHTYDDSWTSLSFKSAVLALSEIIIWFKNYIDLNYPNI
jgi:hypothetical protein